ncbi:MAG TPA: hypothetical protein VHQ66_16685 [Myxococcota bacterium]|nr:hypothetical protein [Myxococcota bacterium]
MTAASDAGARTDGAERAEDAGPAPPAAQGPGRRRTRRLEAALLAASLVALALGGARALTDRFEFAADAEHLVMAWNLAHHGVVSRYDSPGAEPRPTWRREPLYPALLAVYLAAATDPAVHDLECLSRGAPPCRPLLRGLKRVNVAIFLALAAASFWAAREVLGPGLLAWAAFAAVVANGVFWGLLDDLRTETAAALALVVASTFLHRIARGSRRARDVAGAGVAFGLLILTKAIFLYVLPALLALAGWLALRPAGRAAALRLCAAAALAFGVAGAWMARNAFHGGRFVVAEDRAVLAIRAEYDTMTWREWRAAWLYYARELGPVGRRLERDFAPADWERLRRDHPDGFYLRAKRNVGAAAQRAGPLRPDGREPKGLDAAARAVILDHLPMHLALIGPLAVQAALVREAGSRPWPLGAALDRLAFAIVPGLLLASAVALARGRLAALAFLLPSLASFALHVGATHAIARYSWPLLPVATIAWAALPALAFGGRTSRANGRP